MNIALPLGGTFTGAFAAVAASADPSGVAPWVSGGAGAIAVAALGEVLRRLLNGTLIVRATKDVEDELAAAIVAAGQREAALMGQAETMRRAVEDVRDEIRTMRRILDERG